MSTKKEQRAIKRPDLFQKLGREQLEKIKSNPTPFLSFVGAIFVIAAGFFAKQYYDNTQLENRVSALYAIDKVYQEEDKRFSDDSNRLSSRLNEINAEVAKLEKVEKPSSEDKMKITSLKKQADTIHSEQEALKPDHSSSNEAYVAFFNQYASTPEGSRAALQVINSLLQEKSFAKAQELTAKVLSHMNTSSLFFTNVSKLNIKLLSETGAVEPALSETEKLFAHVDETEQPEVLLLKGILLIQKEDHEAAKKTFDTIVTHFHATDEHKSQAKAYKALIL